MQALMKYWNDPATLAKLGERLGDVEAAPAPGIASAAPPAPEINTLLDAAKCAPLRLTLRVGSHCAITMRSGQQSTQLSEIVWAGCVRKNVCGG